jgi:hypothetical protein
MGAVAGVARTWNQRLIGLVLGFGAGPSSRASRSSSLRRASGLAARCPSRSVWPPVQ